MFKVLVFWNLALAVTSLLNLEPGQTLSLAELEADPLVRLVRTSGQLSPLDLYQNQYFSLIIKNKNKKKAYDHFKFRYSRIISLLKRDAVIPHESTLVKSKVKSRFIPRTREWEFKITFAFGILESEASILQAQIIELGGKQVDATQQINFLDEKWVALRLFQQIKRQLQDALLKASSELAVLDIVDLDIDGMQQYSESQKIQEQMEEEANNQSNEKAWNQDQSQEKKIEQNDEIVHLEMKVIFKVGRGEKKGVKIPSASSGKSKEQKSLFDEL